MAGFHYRLERVLELRKQAVEQHKQMLARMIAATRAAQAAVLALETEQTRMNTAWCEAARTGLTPQAALDFANFTTELERRKRQAQAELERAQTEELARRALLDIAMNKQKVLEKPKARALKRYQVETGRKDQAALDEFATLRGDKKK